MVTQRLTRFLTAAEILTQLYPGSVTLIPAQGRNTLIVPASPLSVYYGSGSAPFGGNGSGLALGYPGHVQTIGIPDITDSVSRASLPVLAAVNDLVLTALANQPLVLSLADGSAAYAPILTSALGSGGTGYSAGDDLTTAIGGSTVHVLTVNGSGVILTYSITDNLPEPVGVQDLSGGDGTGATLTILTTGPHGNGQLYIAFDYQVITVPFPIH